jgi:hypothetical protein
MAQTNVQAFSGDVEVAGTLTVSGTLTSTTGVDTVALATDATDASRPIIFSTGTTGSQPLKTDAGITYNPSTNTLSVAGGIDNVALAADATDASRPIIFSTGTTGSQSLKTDAGITYNPSTNTLSVAGGIDNVVLATDATDASRPIIFSTGTTGSQPLKTDAGITYNPSTNKLSVAGGLSTSISPGDYLTGTAYDGSTARTFAVDATDANTVSKVVARDASGNFSAGTITAALTGNADTATTLQTARNINGVSFDGSAAITVTANTPNTLTRGNYLTGDNFNGGTGTTWAVDATSANTASKVVARDASGNFSAGTITATLTGNADTATQVNVTGRDNTNETHYPTFTSTHADGNTDLYQDSGFTYNPSSGTLTSTTFSGALSGNASTASQVNVTSRDSADASHYPTFTTTDADGNASLYQDAGFTYNPSTGTLTSTTFAGALSGNASTASQVNVTGRDSTDAVHYPTFTTTHANGNTNLYQDSGFTYNPSSGTLTSTTFSGALTGNADTATTATNQSGGTVSATSGTFSGDISFTDSGTTTRGIQGVVGGSDYWFVGGGATASNAGYMEIASGDDAGTEPIYARQYQGPPLTGTVQRTLTLLDGSGNSSFPGTVTATSGFTGDVTGNADTATQVYVTSRDSTDASHYPTFTTTDGDGNTNLYQDAGFTYNPSTGTLTSTVFSGTNGNFFGTVAVNNSLDGTMLIAGNGLNYNSYLDLRAIARSALLGQTGGWYRLISYGSAGRNGHFAIQQMAIDGASVQGERLTINGSGNVGIGTASPLAKLDVAGTIISQGDSFENLLDPTGTWSNNGPWSGHYPSIIINYASANPYPGYEYSFRIETQLSNNAVAYVYKTLNLRGPSWYTLSGARKLVNSQGFTDRVYIIVYDNTNSVNLVYKNPSSALTDWLDFEYPFYVSGDVEVEVRLGGTYNTDGEFAPNLCLNKGGIAARRVHRSLLGVARNSAILANGNVGIGTASPASKLTVLGKDSTMPGLYNASYLTGASIMVSENNYNVEDARLNSEHYSTLIVSSDHASDSGNNAAGSIGFAAPNQFGGYSVQYGQISGVRLGNFYGGLSFSTMHSLNDGILREDMRIANGNVGIGTVSVGAKLDILASSTDPGAVPTVHIGDASVDYGDYGMLQLTRDPTNGGSKAHAAFIRNGNTVFGMGYHNNTNTFGFWPSFSTVTNTPTMAFQTDGKVGIGTASPQELLHVQSTQHANVVISSVSEFSDVGLFFRTPFNATSPPKCALIASGGSFSGHNGQLDICFDTTNNNDAAYRATPAKAKVTFKADGNVGIGVTSPAAKLDSRSGVGNGTASWISGTFGGTGAYPRVVMGALSSVACIGAHNSALNAWDKIYLNDPAKPVVVDTNGNVGIGTASPNSKLDVYQGANTSFGGGATIANSTSLTLSSSGAKWGLFINTNSDLIFVGKSGNTGSYTGVAGYVLNGNRDTLMNFTGQHRTFIKDIPSNNAETFEGLIVSADQNEYIRMSGGIDIGSNAITTNESLPVVSLSKKVNDKKCFGVISTSEDPDNREEIHGNFGSVFEKERGDTRVYINSVGEGAIWVTNINGSLESGDYITTSNIPGYGQRQDSEFLANYTVAKITMDCDFSPVTKPVKRIVKQLSNVNYYTNSLITMPENDYKKLSQDDQNEYTLEIREELVNMLDENGQLQWEDDPSGATEKAYKIRYLTTDGTQTDEANAVHIAAFVGCTYHCG